MCVTSRPLIVMVPVSGRSSPAIARSSVDLPEPLGPNSAVSDPDGTSKSTLSSAAKSPYGLLAPRTMIALVISRVSLCLLARTSAPGVEDHLNDQDDHS